MLPPCSRGRYDQSSFAEECEDIERHQRINPNVIENKRLFAFYSTAMGSVP